MKQKENPFIKFICGSTLEHSRIEIGFGKKKKKKKKEYVIRILKNLKNLDPVSNRNMFNVH